MSLTPSARRFRGRGRTRVRPRAARRRRARRRVGRTPLFTEARVQSSLVSGTGGSYVMPVVLGIGF
ncbi:MAG: hypothetical protein JO180_12360 [Gemmatirosa sp.]|nr:hypothetical protein [Gemmatirosa sp.]